MNGAAKIGEDFSSILLSCAEPCEAEALFRLLLSNGYRVDGCPDSLAICSSLEAGHYDAVLLSRRALAEEVIDICRVTRARLPGATIVVMTVRASISEKIAALDAGADDVLPLASDPGELSALIAARLRRASHSALEIAVKGNGTTVKASIESRKPGYRLVTTSGAANQSRLTAGPIALDPWLGRVEVDGSPVRLSGIPYRILTCLIEHRGRCLEREWLRAHAMGTHGSLRRVDHHVFRLRQALGAAGRLIKARPRLGYVLEVT